MKKLRWMARDERLRCFKFEEPAERHQHIQILELGEAGVGHLNRHLQTHAWKALRQLALVDLLVEEPAKLAMNLEDAAHHCVSQFSEFGLR